MFWFKVDLDRNIMQPNFHTHRIRSHDLEMMDNTFGVPVMLAVTTEPSGTTHSTQAHYRCCSITTSHIHQIRRDNS